MHGTTGATVASADGEATEDDGHAELGGTEHDASTDASHVAHGRNGGVDEGACEVRAEDDRGDQADGQALQSS